MFTNTGASAQLGRYTHDAEFEYDSGYLSSSLGGATRTILIIIIAWGPRAERDVVSWVVLVLLDFWPWFLIQPLITVTSELKIVCQRYQ